MTTPATRQGIVLLGHGSRDALWHKPIEAIAAQIAALSPHTPVVCAFVELSAPDLASATRTLIVQSVQEVTILPVFLGMGKHARDDLPRLLSDMQATHPQVSFVLKPTVGEDPRLVRLLAQIALEGL